MKPLKFIATLLICVIGLSACVPRRHPEPPRHPWHERHKPPKPPKKPKHKKPKPPRRDYRW